MTTDTHKPPAPPAPPVVEVEKVVPGGYGLCRTDAGIVLVPGALPQERIALTEIKKKRGTRYCYNFEIVEASPERRSPDCHYHPRCGGCAFLGFSAKAQADAKRAMVVDALTRTGRIPGADDVVEAVVSPPEGKALRRRCRLRIDGKGRVGFNAAGSTQLVPINTCVALTSVLQKRILKLHDIDGLPAMRLRLAHDDHGHVSAAVEEAGDGAAGVVPFLVEQGVCDGAVWLTDEGDVLEYAGTPELAGEVASHFPTGTYRSDAACFTQATRFGGTEIARQVMRHLEDAEFDGGPVVELFAGAGHITFDLAKRAEYVVAIEGAPHATSFLRRNADAYVAAGGDDNVRTIWGHIDGETFPSKYAELLEEFPEALVLDPPRTGVEKIETLIDALEPEVVIMVSCDLATGARDLRAVMTRGYRLMKVTPIDAFPRTSHVEWVASLIFEESLMPKEEAPGDDSESDAKGAAVETNDE